MTLARFLVLGALLSQASAHPSPSLRAANITCNRAVKGGAPITYYSYHIHVLYWQHDTASVAESMALQQKFISTFNIDPKAPCDDSETTHGVEPALCIVDRDEDHAYCPFLTTEWAAFVPPANLSAMIPFFTQNRGNLDVLVHSNSGCEVWDHLSWPMWSGNKWELDGSCLHYNCPGCDMKQCENAGMALYNNITSSTNPCAGNVCSAACRSFVMSAAAEKVDCPSFCSLQMVPPTSCNAAMSKLDNWTAQNKQCL
eukprot:TRINITY_DN33535_c0_g1_i1.p1 TRINITY_DN33535_c0_g1~~TRINITY_DN33535_c0_g1_i1.p1  ORF type:complete len:256 (+),score=48.86 TRINITY_DN33535_c0_g1_i1:51-818(+)